MFDGNLAKYYASHSFRRADTIRDERADIKSHIVEDFLRSVESFTQKKSISKTEVEVFSIAVEKNIKALGELSDEKLAILFVERIESLKLAPNEEKCLASVFAIIGEACKRVFEFYPHGVQYMGARTLLKGELAEMQTGEGKTLVAAMAATAMAGSGASVHVVSTNDYLAQRDAEEMQLLYGFFGLCSGCVIEGMELNDRRVEYRKNICYLSGKELVFDYLKDRLSGHGYYPARVSYSQQIVKPEKSEAPLIPCLHFCIVDEADSILLDEARTPLIISRDSEGIFEPELIQWAIRQTEFLNEEEHFSITAERVVLLLDAALKVCEPMPDSVSAVWHSARWKIEILKQAVSAVHLFIRDQHYILDEGKIQIVDESTGRVMPDRTWEQGLHQLIECKENVELSKSRDTLAKMTFQRFFRRYFLLSGLTGTAAESRRELWSVYGLAVRQISPNKDSKKIFLPSVCVSDVNSKWNMVAQDTIAALERGQPVLVGTRSVEASEAVSATLKMRGIEHLVLNARQDNDEANIIKLAGQSKRVTVATNMAGRGTDIKLTEEARKAGGLHVILTDYHESRRVDRQLFGRSGRQGDAGSVRAIISAQDLLFEHHSGLLGFVYKQLKTDLQRRKMLPLIRKWSQWVAERKAYRARKQTLKQDKSLHKLIGFAGKTL